MKLWFRPVQQACQGSFERRRVAIVSQQRSSSTRAHFWCNQSPSAPRVSRSSPILGSGRSPSRNRQGPKWAVCRESHSTMHPGLRQSCRVLLASGSVTLYPFRVCWGETHCATKPMNRTWNTRFSGYMHGAARARRSCIFLLFFSLFHVCFRQNRDIVWSFIVYNCPYMGGFGGVWGISASQPPPRGDGVPPPPARRYI